MYKLAVKNTFKAYHFLIGGDWGTENQKHSHQYQIEIRIEGKDLDNHGLLVDIVEIKDYLEKLLAYYRERTLNELPEFRNINPSLENLARISYNLLYQSMNEFEKSTLTVKVWEDQEAWAAYRKD